MITLRLRLPNGAKTLSIDSNNSTVQDLQERIAAESSIPPALQSLKFGYPPKSVAYSPRDRLSSLGLKTGDQITVSQVADAEIGAPPSQPARSNPPALAPIQAQVPSQSWASAQGDYDYVSSGAAFSSLAPGGKDGGPNYVATDAGVLVHRVVPDDNSCLFTSVALVFEQDMDKAYLLRQIVADAIRNDPTSWSDAILGQPRESYISTILRPTSWGGAIELAILAQHYGAEIASVDVETGRIDKFSPAINPLYDLAPPTTRCILIYSGIHYDAASLAPSVDAPPEFHQTVFSIEGEDENSDVVLRAAKLLVDILREKRAFTNTATFMLKCETCKTGLKGEKEAREHASRTGHTDFGEY